MIQIENILPLPLKETKINPETQIWNHQFSLKKGKNYLIKAPSGKGKSTFLHLIYGIRKDYEGKIEWKEQNIAQFSENEWSAIRQNNISIVFQNLRLFPQLTGLENILLNHPDSAITEKDIQEMAHTLGIEDLLNKPTQQLSFGQQQRVAIIRALVQKFDFLLLDEPFSHLDNANIENAIQLISKRCKALDASLILVSLGEDYGFHFDHTLLL